MSTVGEDDAALKRRFALFLLGCIPVRCALVYTARTLPASRLPIMGWFALIPAIGFLYIFLSGSRKTGAEVAGGKIWWNTLRPVHAALYFAFAYMAIHQQNPQSWLALLADVALGLVAFGVHHGSADY